MKRFERFLNREKGLISDSVKALHYARFSESLKGENVVIVGGAKEYDQEMVESASFVVHANLHQYQNPKVPNDAIFVAGCVDVPSDFENDNFDFILGNVDGILVDDWFDIAIKTGATFVPYRNRGYLGNHPDGTLEEPLSAFNKGLRTKPFTGIVAVWWCLRALPLRVFVTGFDFYFDKEKGFPIRNDSHVIEPQMIWLAEQVRCDSRLYVDARLKEILPRPKHEITIQKGQRIGHQVFEV